MSKKKLKYFYSLDNLSFWPPFQLIWLLTWPLRPVRCIINRIDVETEKYLILHVTLSLLNINHRSVLVEPNTCIFKEGKYNCTLKFSSKMSIVIHLLLLKNFDVGAWFIYVILSKFRKIKALYYLQNYLKYCSECFSNELVEVLSTCGILAGTVVVASSLLPPFAKTIKSRSIIK